MLTVKGYLLTLCAVLALLSPTSAHAKDKASWKTACSITIDLAKTEYVLGEEVYINVRLTNMQSPHPHKQTPYNFDFILEFDVLCDGDSLTATRGVRPSCGNALPMFSIGDSVIGEASLSWQLGRRSPGLEYTSILPVGDYIVRVRFWRTILSNETRFQIREPSPKEQIALDLMLDVCRAAESGDLGGFQVSLMRFLANPDSRLYAERLILFTSGYLIAFDEIERSTAVSLIHLLWLKFGPPQHRDWYLGFYEYMPQTPRRNLMDELASVWPEVAKSRGFQIIRDR